MKNLVNKITTLLFLGFIFGVFILNVIKNPTEFSISERRKLAQFPDLSYNSVMNGDFMNKFGDYSVDQTAFREDFRKVKAFFDLNILRKSDNNDIFVHDGYVFKTQYPMNTQSVTRLCGIVNAVCDKYLNESNKIMYSVAPDKNAYIGGSKYLVLDYDEMLTLIRENINGDIPYTDIFGDVSLDCFTAPTPTGGRRTCSPSPRLSPPHWTPRSRPISATHSATNTSTRFTGCTTGSPH